MKILTFPRPIQDRNGIPRVEALGPLLLPDRVRLRRARAHLRLLRRRIARERRELARARALLLDLRRTLHGGATAL